MSTKCVCDLSCGAMHEFALVLDKAGFNADLVQNIVNSKGNKLAEAMYSALNSSRIVTINRTTPFNPTFIGEGSKMAEQDKRALKLAEIDLATVRFETTLGPGEEVITGEERLKRLKKAGYVRLDAKMFLTLWENQHLIPESWKEKINGNIRFIFFDGTVLLLPDGNRYTLCLDWNDGRWYWSAHWLVHGRHARNPSAVLAS